MTTTDAGKIACWRVLRRADAMWPSILFASLLMLLSVGLLVSHLAARRTHRAANLGPQETEYRCRQFRRRMQASALLGTVGFAILGGLWVDGPPLEALYWLAVLAAVVWILFLAGADIASTQSFFRDVQQRRSEEHAALQQEIERYRRQEGNGRHE